MAESLKHCGKIRTDIDIADRYENQDPDKISTVLLNNFTTYVSQGDDGCLPLDNPGRHRDEDEDCTKGKPTFTNDGDRLEQSIVGNPFHCSFVVFLNIACPNWKQFLREQSGMQRIRERSDI